MSNTDFALAIEDLTVSFDGFKAIDALTLYVDKNELRVIIGPSGAGKTTLLDLICGKTKAQSGSIKFKNFELTKMAEFQRVRLGIGRKFQTPSICETLSVFQSLPVSFPTGRSVLDAPTFKCDDEVKSRVRAVSEDTHLPDKLGTEAGLLSHGKGIAYVPQGRMIFPTLSVEENIQTGLEYSITRRIPEEIYALFPVLWDMRGRKGDNLSGGQQQLAIARALVTEHQGAAAG